MERVSYAGVGTPTLKPARLPFLRRRSIKTVAAVVAILTITLLLGWDSVVLGNRQIVFYGRVIDENGNTLPGRTVVFTIYRRDGVLFTPLIQGPSKSVTYHRINTDANGRFRLTAYGREVYQSGMVWADFFYNYNNKQIYFDYGSFVKQDLPTSSAKEYVITVNSSDGERAKWAPGVSYIDH
jgi:hypothetical protein